MSRIAKALLRQIGDAIAAWHVKFENVFKDEGVLSTDEFIDGLEAMDLDKFDKKEFLTLFEYLRKEGEDVIDVHFFKEKLDEAINP